MFDDDDGVPHVDEAHQDVEEFLDVGEVQADRRLVEDVEGVAVRPFSQFAGELDPLRLAPREGRRRLAEADVPQPHVVQELELPADRRDVLEEAEGLLDGHVEDLGDVLVLVPHVEGIQVEPMPAADIAGHIDVREEVHLDLDQAVPLAGLAAPPLHVEAEPARFVAPEPRLGKAGEEVADVREDAGVGDGIRAGGPPDGLLVHQDDPLDAAEIGDAADLAACRLLLVDPPGERLVQGLDDHRALPRAGNPGHRGEDPDGDSDVDLPEVVLVRPLQDDPPFRRGPALLRQGNGLSAGEIGARQGNGACADLLRRPLEDNLAPVYPRPRTHVDDLVRFHHHVLVVLHDQDGVSHVAESLQGGNQADVVPLVEADGRLVEDVQDAHQPRADLRGKADPLPLASGEAPRRPLQAQVIHADVEEEAEPLADLLHHPFRHLRLLRGQRDRHQKVEAGTDRHPTDLVDVLPRNPHREALLLQPGALAGRAVPEVDIPRKVQADVERGRLLVAPVELVQNPLEGPGIEEPPTAPIGVEADLLVPGAVEEDVLDRRRELLERGVDVELVVVGQGVDRLKVVERVAARPGHDRPLPDGKPRVGDDELLVEVHPGSQPTAVRAGAVGAVEGEHPGGELGDADAAVRAGVPLAEEHLPPAGQGDADQAVGEPRGGLQGVAQALPDPLLDDQAVDDHVDVVALVLIEGDLLGELPEVAVHADADIALLQEFPELLLELPLLPPGERGHDRQPCVRGVGEERLQHRIDRLGLDLLPAEVTVGNADPGEEQPEVIVDLRHRSHGGAGVMGGRPLFDGDGWREPLDRLHLGLVHLPDELPRVGGERLYVAPLPLGVDRVEGERRLPRTGDAGDDHEPVARDVDADVLEVMLGCALDFDPVHYRLISMCDFARRSMSHSSNFFSVFSMSSFPWISSRTDSMDLSPAPRRSITRMM